MLQAPQLWGRPLILVMAYPGLIHAFAWALGGYRESGRGLLALYASLAMLLAGSIPVLAIRALILMRQADGHVPARGALYLMVAVPSLFSLTYTLTRIVIPDRHYAALSTLWIAAWAAVGLLLYYRKRTSVAPSHDTDVKRLRIVHGTVALLLLCGFLIPHLVNHDLAAWSVTLHATAMKWLRLWYRSAWVEPVLLGLFLVMIGTGVRMAVHHSRRGMDAFRAVQLASGVYLGVFIASHVFATLYGRYKGAETDWFFAAGPTSLLDGSLLGRLIPHYFFAVVCLSLHVACGLRVVMLQHGAARPLADRVMYGLTATGVMVTAVLMAALLGFHFVT